MKHRADDDFWQAYAALPEPIRKQADKRFALLQKDPKHPSLHFKKIGTLWSARVSRGYRALAVEYDGGFLWFWIGPHDEYERLIR